MSFISAFVSAWETLFGPMVLISEKYPTKDGSQLFNDLGLCGLSSYRSTVRMSDIYCIVVYFLFSVTSNQSKANAEKVGEQ